MTRNSKSNNDGAVFTYYERHVAKLGGTRHRRLPGVSMKKWYHCALSLTTPRDAVVTPSGVIYDREAILRHFVHQKQEQKENARKRQTQADKLSKRSEYNKLSLINNAGDDKSITKAATSGVSNESTGKAGEDCVQKTSLNFWLPGGRRAEPEASKDVTKLGVEVVEMKSVGKKFSRTLCPVLGTPLRMRDLITLNLTPSPSPSSSSSSSLIDRGTHSDSDLFVCPVCSTVLSNASKPVALRTGTVLCTRCMEQFVKNSTHTDKKSARDPITLAEIDISKDIIVILNHGTGFAGSAADDPGSKEASWYQPSMT